jgi:hypothetical protein
MLVFLSIFVYLWNNDQNFTDNFFLTRSKFGYTEVILDTVTCESQQYSAEVKSNNNELRNKIYYADITLMLSK